MVVLRWASSRSCGFSTEELEVQASSLAHQILSCRKHLNIGTLFLQAAREVCISASLSP